MKAKLIVEGREFPIEIQDPELEKLLRPEKNTGYERVECNSKYYIVNHAGCIGVCTDRIDGFDAAIYNSANYYSARTVAENNARADKLMRQLRRFAVEHRKDQLYWEQDHCNEKWSIEYDCRNKRLRSNNNWDVRKAFVVYFDSEETVDLAIKTFRDELIWYFTEYKESL